MSEKRLIDVDALVAELKDNRDNDSNRYMYWYQKEERDAKYDFAINWIYDAPTVDAVEVVRCQNCIHWDDEEEVCLKIYSDGAVSPYAWQHRNADDFCSYGERKDHEHH